MKDGKYVSIKRGCESMMLESPIQRIQFNFKTGEPLLGIAEPLAILLRKASYCGTRQYERSLKQVRGLINKYKHDRQWVDPLTVVSPSRWVMAAPYGWKQKEWIQKVVDVYPRDVATIVAKTHTINSSHGCAYHGRFSGFSALSIMGSFKHQVFALSAVPVNELLLRHGISSLWDFLENPFEYPVSALIFTHKTMLRKSVNPSRVPYVAWNFEYKLSYMKSKITKKYFKNAAFVLEYSKYNYQFYTDIQRDYIQHFPVCYHSSIEPRLQHTNISSSAYVSSNGGVLCARLFGTLTPRWRRTVFNGVKSLLSGKNPFNRRTLTLKDELLINQTLHSVNSFGPMEVDNGETSFGYSLRYHMLKAPVSLNIHSYYPPGKAPLEMHRLIQAIALKGSVVISERGTKYDKILEDSIRGEGLQFVDSNITTAAHSAIRMAHFIASFCPEATPSVVQERMGAVQHKARTYLNCESLQSVVEGIRALSMLLPPWYFQLG
eukprot:gb/GECG01006826.1/.p1 GENE.gb/GECG01006826.1/~~gb/GECG01006826.1/.p1  ORF type:complete len:491 (+),score=34.02 gb/GECG01006826.1/:1-1473(+)